MKHFRRMLKQAIQREQLSHPEEWERILSSLLLKVADRISPNVQAGDSMDVRSYIKIKKIPGGKINQSEYVDGIVITQNVAHKQMPRHMINPRIMVLTFPLDYHRVENQFMSLDPLLQQEKNYLRHLTRRVIDVRPHIVLVERSVSKVALDFLLEAKVSVSRGVKPSAIHQVARCAQADIIASMDRLALEPRLGRCTELRIQTFEHSKIPGYRKTYMRFEGCNDSLGCSVILRGGDWDTLKKVKKIANFMAMAAANLKLEVCLFYDEFNVFPPEAIQNIHSLGRTSAAESKYDTVRSSTATETGHSRISSTFQGRVEEQEEADKNTDRIQKSLEPYLKTALSTSCAIAYPPPGPLSRMGILDDRLRALRQARDDAEAALILRDEGKSHIVADEPGTPMPNPETTAMEMSSEYMSSHLLDSQLKDHQRDYSDASTVTRSENIGGGGAQPTVLYQPSEIQLESDIAFTAYEHAEQMKTWSWYCSRYPADLRPDLFQGVIYLSAMVCEGSDKPCHGPTMLTNSFYGADDCTLGQYLDRLATSAGKPCPSKTCNRLQLYHFHVLAHGPTRLQIAIDQFPCPSPGNEDKIITWSYCKICKTASPTAIIKDETWRMSWAKYLEHSFYPASARNGFGCPHDIYRDQIRYFGFKHLAIRIHNEVIDVYEVIRPALALHITKKTKVVLKNQEYEAISYKIAAFCDSVVVRLKTFDIQMVPADKVCR